MGKCERCKKTYRNNEMVSISDNENKYSESICLYCYNKEMIEDLGIEDFKDFNKHIVITDCAGIEHKFEITKRICITGIIWEAIEFLENGSIGYSFEVFQGFDDDSSDTVTRLNKKVKYGVSKKYICRDVSNGHESLTLKEDVIEGKIEWDDNYNGRIPKFKIGGKEYSAEQIAKILMSYEGWNFKLRIKASTD